MDQVGAATEMSEARPHTSQEEDNASRDEQETESAVRRSESPWREPGDSPAKKPGAYEARVLVRRREMAEVGPTHRALCLTTSLKASRRHGAGPGALRTAY
jgi:hypothetical protein